MRAKSTGPPSASVQSRYKPAGKRDAIVTRNQPTAEALEHAMARLVAPLEAMFSKAGCGPPRGSQYQVLSATESAEIGDGWHGPGVQMSPRTDLDWHAPYLTTGISASVDDAKHLEALPDSVMESVIMAQSRYLRTVMTAAQRQWVGVRWTNPADGSSVAIASRIEFYSDLESTEPEAAVRTEMSYRPPAITRT